MPTGSEFEHELQMLINKHSIENASDTPDFILAKYMRGCLEAYQNAVTRRDRWYNFHTEFKHTTALEGKEEQ